MSIPFIVVGEYFFSLCVFTYFFCFPSYVFWCGTACGMCWEMFNHVMGKQLLSLVNFDLYKYFPGITYPVLHAIDDGLIFVILDKLSPDNDALFVLLAMIQECCVEIAFNSRFWKYHPVWYNPTSMFVPLSEWLFFSIIFRKWIKNG